MLTLGRDDIIRIHRHAMESTGEAPREFEGLDLPRLDNALEMAMWFTGDDANVLDHAALVACQVAGARAFPSGNARTALLVAAVLLALNREPLRDDWSEGALIVAWAASFQVTVTDAYQRMSSWLRS